MCSNERNECECQCQSETMSLPKMSQELPHLASPAMDAHTAELLPARWKFHTLVGVFGDESANAFSVIAHWLLIERGYCLLEVEIDTFDVIVL